MISRSEQAEFNEATKNRPTECPLPQRKHIRLAGYDYSQQGCYFITICTYGKAHTLCTICRGDPCGCPLIEYTPLGKIAEKTLWHLEERYSIELDAYAIMPNHVHLLMTLPSPNERATARVAPTVGQIVGAYKSLVVHEWRKECNAYNIHMGTVWQRSFFEHIIRNEMDFLETQRYIDENPARWLTGADFP